MTKIKLLGREVSIKVISAAELRQIAKARGEVDVYGMYDPISYTIYIEDTLSGEALRRVILHEVTHALLSFSGVHNMLKGDLEDALCDLNENLLELFQDSDFVEAMRKT